MTNTTLNSDSGSSFSDYVPPENLLQGRNILITGAGDGIGRTLALACANYGATVILLGRTTSKLEAVYDKIEAAGGAQPAIIPLDLATASAEELFGIRDAIEGSFDTLHGLVHNAAILGDRKPFATTSYTSWLEVMQVNVNAALVITQAALPLLEQADDASIVFTASSVGRKGRAYWGAYATSKSANEGMMEVLADELCNTSNIRVNSLNPGGTNTQMRRLAFPAENPQDNPSPEAIMSSYLFLLGPDSIGVTGEKLSAQ
ncbi:MAG: NAD(P)-dependent dehydrogenase (short-subunit alcohol dehydrogenase family) [Halieaceae bacterium]|jgi:NAD(P)-dependent dehydrogenase (short-subunit alcohol dehydrogenase family)